MTAEKFEPDQVGSAETETGGLTGSEPPPAPPQTPADSTTSPPLTSEETEGIDPTAALEPTYIGGESAGGGKPDTLGPDVGFDAGIEPSEADEPSPPDASVPPPPDASVPRPSEPPPDASTARTNPPPLAEPESNEPCPGVVFRDSCYQFVVEWLSWNLAEERCVAWGGHLASIESSEEDAFIGVWPTLFGVPEGGGSGIWLGGTDARQDGDFRWPGDRPLSFVGWALNQPDDGQGIDCIQKRNDGTGLWYDRRCVDSLPYVCERAQ